MKRLNDALNHFLQKEKLLLEELEGIEQQLSIIGTTQKSLVVRNIQDKQYYYEQWRENGHMVSAIIGRVAPGVAAKAENEKLLRASLVQKKKDDLFLLGLLQKNIAAVQKKIEEKAAPENFFFEVYWRDQLVSRVTVRKESAHVSRYTEQPDKQLFEGDTMDREQILQIFRERCFDPTQPDAEAKLKALGLDEYDPLEIVRRTHGVAFNDDLWFRFPGETMSAEEILN